MKTFKLLVHQKNFSEDDVILYQRDYTNCNIGDIIEIYSPEDEFSRLLLQISSFPDERDLQHKDKPTISVEQSVASTFQLRPYGDVIVNKVNTQDVVLDSVEVIFKDQYLARSDMWRTRCNLVDKVVYLNKKFEYPSLRFQIFEMWAQGERVASGYVDKDTKIVFRSASSMVYLFLQMSSEMWDFDINGDLYFEKAINGFVCDLFDKWRRFSCNHDVTIVLFSRTYYEANSIEEFPEEMRDCLQQDYQQRFYEDFYRIAVQNERYDEWNSTVILLKKLFNIYQNEVLRYHEKWEKPIPKAYNSTASQGNILEVLNMSLNVFEKHYMDRSFDRTGQLSVIISPGVGVFEVDFDLTSITKQRIIDNGIGSDLVCLGEQPLHAVPIFKYNRRKDQHQRTDHVYNMPHWINLSFYSSRKQSRFSSFIPRIKIPDIVPKHDVINVKGPDQSDHSLSIIQAMISAHTDVFGDDFDCTDGLPEHSVPNDMPTPSHSYKRCIQKPKEDNFISPSSGKPGKMKLPINPFDPSQVTIKLTSNRRRWTHVFPLGPSGVFMQQHHFQALPQNTACTLIPISCNNISFKKTSTSNNELDGVQELMRTPEHMLYSNKDSEERRSFMDRNLKSKLSISSTTGLFGEKEWTPSITTGVDWKSLIIPACLPLTTDFLPDHRSLEKDYLDSEYSLIPEDQGADLSERRCYRDEDYHNHLPLKTVQVFQEFICQRLQQGFQIILFPNTSVSGVSGLHDISALPGGSDAKSLRMNLSSSSLGSLTKSSPLARMATTNQIVTNQTIPSSLERNYTLSIGRIFHRVEMDNFTIKVKISRPRYPYQVFKIHYCYRFRAPDNDSYGVSWVDFTNEKLENFNWNYLDNYICLRGDEQEYELRENLKFWRLRLLLLPSMQSYTKQILESITSNRSDFRCDIYRKITLNEKLKLQEGFLKFFEIINRIRRPAIMSKKSIIGKDGGLIGASKPNDLIGRRYSSGFSLLNTRTINSVGSASTLNPNDPMFRDRLSSSVLHDRPKPKITIKADKCREEMEPSINSPLSEPDMSRSAFEQLTSPITVVPEQPIQKKISGQSLTTIIETMKNGSMSLNFLPKQATSPSHTFISADAVNWALEWVDGIQTEFQAINLFQRMLDNRLICHASGDFAYPFKHGFYLYFLVNKANKLIDDRVDLEIYKREWFEVELSSCRQGNDLSFGKPSPPVEIVPAKHSLLTLKNPLSSLRSSSAFSISRLTEPNVNKQTCKGTSYYKSMLDIDSGVKSGRTEWVHIKYQQLYDPAQAFEMVLEWMVATSNQIADIVQGWARKAGMTGLHLVPIPSDPFALPFSSKSDPLRSPIYVPLSFDCLPNSATEELLGSESRLLEFRIEILTRFGFLPFLGGFKENQKQYVHVSGSIFVLIPNSNVKEKLKKENSRNSQHLDDENSTPHEIYISRHFSGLKQNKKGIEAIRTGFLWSWNYMISKRWKTPTTGDENFQRKVLRDFRLFCSNDHNRLCDFWESFAIKNGKQADS